MVNGLWPGGHEPRVKTWVYRQPDKRGDYYLFQNSTGIPPHYEYASERFVFDEKRAARMPPFQFQRAFGADVSHGEVALLADVMRAGESGVEFTTYEIEW